MKFSVITVLALAFLVFSQDAFSQHRRPGNGGGRGGNGGRDGWDRGGRRGPRHPRRDNTYTTVTCAPEVVANNLQTADQVLGELATNELKDSIAFTARISEVAAISSAQEKTEAYLNLVGVDANNSEEVLNFLYAREANAKNVLVAQKNLDLNADQASLVINRLTEALKPVK